LLEGGKMRVATDESAANLRGVLEDAKDFPMLFVGPPPVVDDGQNQRIAQLDRLYEKECRAQGVPFLSVIDALRRSFAWISEAEAYDGAHPGALGYAELTLLIQQWLPWQSWVQTLAGASS
jgi:hypothetical protein